MNSLSVIQNGYKNKQSKTTHKYLDTSKSFSTQGGVFLRNITLKEGATIDPNVLFKTLSRLKTKC